ncbi:uncharacterized protein MONBRDRAFT_10725 [Monosiga brevicollis MX1]|uniref:Lysosomal Pro-X carboxypeptidase n=1 Tax=Monosiga brevicollis TaxID=81824 RepID=A9V719_MONBE|nr:uncharacterized protein MONBRDRAFT_10725 [Monosiga brevicollis MX1]EDQ86644.1 predicted protein [Monosiga brevicollis MX1]|eukprot:XP_001748480.1 hypothetical protein [Monosiga brevicollis MX1]
MIAAVLALSLLAAATTSAATTPTSNNCTELTFEQTIDHFNWGAPLGQAQTTFQQRYFVYDKYYKPGSGALFVYFGNEDDITLYINHTGLMWENAKDFGAYLIFIEHRYYGKSQPFSPGTAGCMNWLTSEQAMADYAVLLRWFKATHQMEDVPTIGFGGSYGGMLAAWFRRKFPDVVDGVISASAPIWAFANLTPAYDDDGFAQIVTNDATPASGAAAACAANFKQGQKLIIDTASSAAGLANLTSIFRLCNPLQSLNDAYSLLYWVQEPWSYMAMGNFPYPSSYLLHGLGMLPAWPVRVACESLADSSLPDQPPDLLDAMRAALDIYYNYTHAETCYDLSDAPETATLMRPRKAFLRQQGTLGGPEACTGDWDYQYCTEMVMPSTQGTDKDMFWPLEKFDLASLTASCQSTWGVKPRQNWATTYLASKDLTDLTNVVFSNGHYDPWRAGGVVQNVSDSVVSIIIPSGAHHIDLMFSTPEDPEDVTVARAFEVSHMRRWVDQKLKARRH